MRWARVAGAVAAGIVLASTPAQAHLVGIEFGDFAAGAIHAGTGLSDLLLLGALALALALQPRERARWALLTLPLGTLAGLALGAGSALAGPPPEPVQAGMLALAGLVAVLAWPVPTGLLAALAGLAGLAIGWANGLPVRALPIEIWLYGAGALTATGLFGTWAIAGLSALTAQGGVPVLGARVLGSWAVAAGSVLLALDLTR